MDTGSSVELKHSLKEWQNPSLRGLCEGRENRRLEPIGTAPISVRGLSSVQYLSRVDEKGYGWWLKVWTGTGRTVKVKRTLKDKQRQIFEGA